MIQGYLSSFIDLHLKLQGLGEKVKQVIYKLDTIRLEYKFIGFGSLVAISSKVMLN